MNIMSVNAPLITTGPSSVRSKWCHLIKIQMKPRLLHFNMQLMYYKNVMVPVCLGVCVYIAKATINQYT